MPTYLLSEHRLFAMHLFEQTFKLRPVGMVSDAEDSHLRSQ